MVDMPPPPKIPTACPGGVLTRRTGAGKQNHVYSDREHAEYAAKLGIPPAYPHVDVCKPGGAVLYVARDAMGREQRRYSAEHNTAREHVQKPAHMKMLTAQVWKELDEAVSAATSKGSVWSVDKLAATAVLLIQSCFFRPGTPMAMTRSVRATEPHFGVTTLQVKHVRHVSDRTCTFAFVGKGGRTNECTVRSNHTLCRLLKELTAEKKPDDRLFRMLRHSLTASELRDFLSRATRGLVRPKDIRTYKANLTFLEALRASEPKGKKKETQESKHTRILNAIDATAKHLNNTRKVARDSYILAPVMRAATEYDVLPPGETPEEVLAAILRGATP